MVFLIARLLRRFKLCLRCALIKTIGTILPKVCINLNCSTVKPVLSNHIWAKNNGGGLLIEVVFEYRWSLNTGGYKGRFHCSCSRQRSTPYIYRGAVEAKYIIIGKVSLSASIGVNWWPDIRYFLMCLCFRSQSICWFMEETEILY